MARSLGPQLWLPAFPKLRPAQLVTGPVLQAPPPPRPSAPCAWTSSGQQAHSVLGRSCFCFPENPADSLTDTRCSPVLNTPTNSCTNTGEQTSGCHVLPAKLTKMWKCGNIKCWRGGGEVHPHVKGGTVIWDLSDALCSVFKHFKQTCSMIQEFHSSYLPWRNLRE